jgi:5-methyltetrahydropteroyltriglutamate--homocysteine methyltransferase
MTPSRSRLPMLAVGRAITRGPELVVERVIRYANVVGRENLIAGNDCGFATSATLDEVHPDVAWTTLQALAEGAMIASKHPWGKVGT